MRIFPVLLITAIAVGSPSLSEGIKIIGKGSIKATGKTDAQPDAPASTQDNTAAPAGETAAAPQAAPGGTVTALNPQSVVTALQDYGVAARLEVDDEGDPVIRTKVAGASTNVYFYGCDDSGADCRSLSFSAGFELDQPYTPEQANEWNINKRFSKSYVTEDGAAQIEMDINLVAGGVTAENFADTIDWWDYSVSEYKTFIGW